MMDLKNIRRAVEQIADEKGIDSSTIIEAIETSIAAAYKKEYEKRGEVIKAQIDMKTGALKFWQVKTVVDDTTVRIVSKEDEETEASPEQESEGEFLPRYNPDRHILLDETREIKKDAELGEELTFPLETHETFGRIAAQTAKQVVLQKLREAERESIMRDFKGKEGDIVSGVIQRFERGNIYVDLGRAIGVMFQSESIPGEHYRAGDRMRFFILAIQEESRLPGIVLSRGHQKFVSKLFALEVPEITDGIVQINAIAREAGSRSKIAVSSTMDGVDPVGACVGQRGTRVMTVSNELSQEKIDIIQWSEDPAVFISNSLSPAKVKDIEILPRREAKVFVDDDQLSLAIGKGGQNVRLAAKLTGWKIDVRSQAEPETEQPEGVADLTQSEEPSETKPEDVAENNQAAEGS
ncbi:MAG: transcription termination/antitermination protein NusA [Candidatus Harrisonbacteria bacterium CG10_big_fil_rev_8_21_14_0_10_40_38]|uniref:Transcription termination/antitermination protein NusA n=1 Tax=Candidatus Harrisonbacteria bacterium CG10_big_fil_rev_8_21_14_0_10_40_38 TaxID=1974583 RepID=A0A2H0URA5_9BACT|nr:MAG: transcription termination/antitermination protein NusA [Candidatus Harrisonbacteria bacterium CG10_big_fil_rev_8_21_14_0_10_40_38]